MAKKNYVDFSDPIKALSSTSKSIYPIVNSAVNKAVEFATPELSRHTPVWDGKKSKGSRGDYMLKHAKDHVVGGKATKGEAFVGYDKDVAWRIHFVEFGTIKQKPQGHIARTQVDIEKKVQQIIENELRRRLGG